MSIRAKLRYCVDTGETPVTETTGPGGRLRRRSGGQDDWREVEIADARPRRASLSIEREGFELVDAPTAMSRARFWDPDALRRIYYPETEALVARVSGAARVVIFDHTLRSQDPARQDRDFAREPVEVVHNDYTERSGPWRVQDVLPDEAEIYQLQHNPAHRWSYFPAVARDEALVFKVYDSAEDGRARFTPHTSFAHPRTPPGAIRESLELRCLCLF